jgi:hypothetical protein
MMMDRRELIAGIAAASTVALQAQEQPNKSSVPNTYLELKVWRLHNSQEDQAVRLADYFEAGLGPALKASNAVLAGAFSSVIGPDGPYYVTLAQFPSLAAFQESVEHLVSDAAHQRELKKLSGASQFPFVRVESSLLRSFDVLPAAVLPNQDEKRPPRIFEMRTYESPSYFTLARKVRMFNQGEARIFERLQMRPVFFGETIVGPRQPNLTYMLSFDDLAARDNLWHAFGTDPEWKTLSAKADLRDPEIVANISNVILRPLTFSLVR